MDIDWESIIAESYRLFGCNLISNQVAYVIEYCNDYCEADYDVEQDYDGIHYILHSHGYTNWTELGHDPEGFPCVIIYRKSHNREFPQVEYYPIHKINVDWFDPCFEFVLIPYKSRSLTSLVTSPSSFLLKFSLR